MTRLHPDLLDPPDLYVCKYPEIEMTLLPGRRGRRRLVLTGPDDLVLRIREALGWLTEVSALLRTRMHQARLADDAALIRTNQEGRRKAVLAAYLSARRRGLGHRDAIWQLYSTWQLPGWRFSDYRALLPLKAVCDRLLTLHPVPSDSPRDSEPVAGARGDWGQPSPVVPSIHSPLLVSSTPQKSKSRRPARRV